jgi:hypothetical protein
MAISSMVARSRAVPAAQRALWENMFLVALQSAIKNRRSATKNV